MAFIPKSSIKGLKEVHVEEFRKFSQVNEWRYTKECCLHLCYAGFGSKYRSPVTGIIYNNEMDDFLTPGKPNGFGVRPSPSNYVKAAKRPMSSISPVIFVRKSDGTVRLIAGASGGTRITTGTSLVVMNNLWFGLPINKSVNYPRVHNQLSNTTHEVKEDRFTISAAIRQGLAARGNYLTPYSRGYVYAAVQAISKEDKADIYAQSDPRKHGWAAGL